MDSCGEEDFPASSESRGLGVGGGLCQSSDGPGTNLFLQPGAPGHTAFAFSGWNDRSRMVNVSPATLISASMPSLVNSLSLLSSLSAKRPTRDTGAVIAFAFRRWSSISGGAETSGLSVAPGEVFSAGASTAAR